MSPIHILTHEFRPKRGGAGVVCERIAATLARLGHRVTVWTPEYVTVGHNDEFTPDYEIRRIPGLRGTRNPGCLWAMARCVIAEREHLRSTVLYLGEPGPIAVFFYLTLFYRPFWKKLVITLHGSELERYLSHTFSRWLFKRLLDKTDVVHVLSTRNYSRLLAEFPELKPKLVRAYGVMLPGEQLPPVPARRISASHVPLRVLCVGRIHPRKGQLHLLQAVAGLDSALQRKLELRFVGQLIKDKYHQKMEALRSKCDASVVFVGGVSDSELEAEYRDADIFALTSMPYQNSVEGLGLVYLEASRFGLPIVANRVGGVADVVAHGQNGLLAESGNIQELREHLKVLIEDPAVRNQLGRVGRERVKGNSWIQVTTKLFN